MKNQGDPIGISFCLAKNVAKVTYNALGEPAPFDYNSGYRIVSSLRHIVDHLNDKAFENKA